MKTTIYELLGMIKDNNTPKKILFKGRQWEYTEDDNDYVSIFNEWLFDEYVITNILNEEVEILETTITYKPNEIEKIDNSYYHLEQGEQNQLFKNKINEIIEKVNNL